MAADPQETDAVEDLACLPSYLHCPPRSRCSPPVQTRAQELPFGELAWEDFERLCLRLARLEADVVHCQLYGTPGQKQEGIDLFAATRTSRKYRAYQCKYAASALQKTSDVRGGHIAGAKEQGADTDQGRANGNDPLRAETIDCGAGDKAER